MARRGEKDGATSKKGRVTPRTREREPRGRGDGTYDRDPYDLRFNGGLRQERGQTSPDLL